MYLAMLDKLLSYSEAHCAYEAGLTYGVDIFRDAISVPVNKPIAN